MNDTKRELGEGCMRLRLSISYEPVGYQNNQDLWTNRPFDESDLDDALSHAVEVFAGEIQQRMAYADLQRRGIKCGFRPGRVAHISLAPEEPVREVGWLRSLTRELFGWKS